MSTGIVNYEAAQELLGPVRVGVMKVLAFLLEFLLHLSVHPAEPNALS
jgi:hypothetical protein